MRSSGDRALDAISRPSSTGRPKSIPWMTLVFALLGIGVVSYIANGVWDYTRADVDIVGISDGDHLQPDADAARRVLVTFADPESAQQSQMTLDGELLAAPEPELDAEGVPKKAFDLTEEQRAWAVPIFESGAHELVLEVPRPMLAPVSKVLKFEVDGRAPSVNFDTQPPVDPWSAVSLSGSVEGAEDVRLGSERIELDDEGRFSIDFDRPPIEPVCVSGRDAAGNFTKECRTVELTYPEIKAIHISAPGWSNPDQRRRVLALLDANVINTVQIDLKDEAGDVGYDSQLPVPDEVGAVRGFYELEETIEELHEHGAHVIGRVVAFNDPRYADWAWDNGHRNRVIRFPDGSRFSKYGGGFLNFGDPDVQQYVLDIALEGARAGVDDIMYDYIRRPDGEVKDMRIDGLDLSQPSAVEQTIVDFLARSHEVLRVEGVYQGAAVFGIAATRPDQIGQNIPMMVEHLDYVSPMLYPSHWNDGEYGVTDPSEQPYDIVAATMTDFVDAADQTGTAVVPWLQDFDMGGVEYGIAEVDAQIEAVADTGGDGWLLWNASSDYSF